MTKREKSHMWTKEEIKNLVSLWDTSTLDDISLQLGLPKEKIIYMAMSIRKQGFYLARKTTFGVKRSLIAESLKELGYFPITK